MHSRFAGIMKKGRSLFLAYDHGMEHGPHDFSLECVNPADVIKVAAHGGYTGLIVHKGIARSYRENYSGKVPLVLKLNGRTSMPHCEPCTSLICSVEEAADMDVAAVAHTILVGSEHESRIFEEFRRVEENARDFGLPVVGIMVPSGRAIPAPESTDIVAYAARVGLEIGVDMVGVSYTGSVDSFRWVVNCAGHAKVLALGGPRVGFEEFVYKVRGALDAGASGLIAGRNIWQSGDFLKRSMSLRSLVFDDMSAEEAINGYSQNRSQ